MPRQNRFTLPRILCLLPGLLFPFLGGCGGGGGGVSSSGPYEIAYILAENSSSSGSEGAGEVVEYALNPSNGSLFPGSQTFSTGGTIPVSFLVGPGNATAYVLNNNSLTGDTNPANGSIATYSITAGSTRGLSGPLAKVPTGPNPVDMAIDPGGGYLVVANHGNGTTSGNGYVQVFSITASGLTSQGSSPSHPCAYPFRVVFGPGASGKSSDTVYVACTSPELLSSPPHIQIYQCTVSELEPGKSCSTTIYNPTSSSVLVTMVLDPSGHYLVAPGTDVSEGFLLVCTVSTSSTTCKTSSSITNVTIPSANIAFSVSGNGETVYIGNYNSAPSSFNGNFAACTISSLSCTLNNSSNDKDGPIAFSANSTTLYIADTVTAVPQSLTSLPSSTPSTGYLNSCSLPISTTTCSSQETGYWPVNTAMDPTGAFLFVPTLSGSVDVFQIASGTGTLSPLSKSKMTVTAPFVPFFVAIPPNP